MNSLELPTLGARISYIKSKVGAGAISKAAKVSTTQINRYIRDESQPTIEPLVAIAEVGNVNLEWLATGKGPMHPDEPMVSPAVVSLDFYPDIQPSAGCGNHVVSENTVPVMFDSDYLRDVVRVAPHHCVLFVACGDSMAPTIASGDLLIVDRSVIRGDDIFVLRLNEDIMVKRLQFLPTGEIEVISDCSAYKNYTLRPDQAHDLQIIGRVAWHGGRC